MSAHFRTKNILVSAPWTVPHLDEPGGNLIRFDYLIINNYWHTKKLNNPLLEF